MYERVCTDCKKSFEASWEHQKFCSKDCRRNQENKRFGRTSDNKIASATVGAISEMAIGMDLMNKGYAVFRALSPACLCDLIAIKEKDNLRIEVRTGYKSEEGKVYFPNAPKDKGRQDIFAIYVRSSKEIFYYDHEKNPKKI